MASLRELITQGGFWKAQAQTVNGSLVTGIVAHAGGTQAAAIADSASWLTGVTNVVATCATSADSCLLPLADQGDVIYVRNNGAAPCGVYPRTGGKINNAAADAVFTVTNAKTAVFVSLGGVDWIAALSA
jgi:hypothetical protein